MSALSAAYGALQDELGDLLADSPMRVVTDLAANVGRRDVVFGPPTFQWEGLCTPDQPDSITYNVYLIESLGERAVERLLDNLPVLLTAVAQLGNETTVTACTPGAFPTGNSDLPCYQVTAETTL